MRRTSSSTMIVVVAAAAVFIAATPAGAVVDEGTLSPPSTDVTGFGRSVAVDGDTAVVGAEGEVHVYERTASGWSHQAALYDANTGFGMFVAVNGDTLAVSVDHETRVYARSGRSWDLQQTLFGQGVAIDGDTLVLGDTGGCMFIYERLDGVWAPAFDDCRDFRLAMAIDGDTLVVGGERGAHVYRRAAGTWSHDVYVELPDWYLGFERDPLRAGHSVAISGGTLAFGQPDGYDVVFGGMTGAVYVYVDTGAGWDLDYVGPLISPDYLDHQNAHDFGRAVALNGDTLIVGATGHAYLFRRTVKATAWWLPWSHEEYLAADGSEHQPGGSGVAMSATTAVIGAPATANAYVYNTAITCKGLVPTIIGTGGDDVITGTSDADIIAGMAGHDIIRGLGGNDVICGDTGNDTIYGNLGRDRILGGYGDDQIFAGVRDDVVWGDAGRDDIDGGSGDDKLRGGDGSNRLWGRSGDDVLVGSADRDFIYGGPGADTVWAGTGRDRVFGGVGDDILSGRGGRDQLHGQDGDDVIDGGAQHDWCSVEISVINCEATLRLLPR